MRAAFVLVAFVLAGCATAPGPPERPPSSEPASLEQHPRLVIALARATWPVGESAEVRVRFENTANRSFNYVAPSTCTWPRVWTRYGERVFDLPSAMPPGTLQACGSAMTPVSIHRGRVVERTLIWNGSYPNPDGTTFGFVAPGTYRMTAEFPALGTWNATSAVNVTVTPGRPLAGPPFIPAYMPHIHIAPERSMWHVGQRINITAWFNNTSSTPFTYTSGDACDDIHVRVEPSSDGSAAGGILSPQGGGYACAAVLTTFTIPPGGNVSAIVVWDGTEPYARAGTRLFRADFDGADAIWPSEGSLKVEVLP
ncbi:MAG TPA: hypothetical protein VGR28_08705 [Candidatus Thermoplasmatota archaeon]|jgi:hypothetical protein|nr:hypothetical protein [Candidatus Thermoplasmatota archaeon]